MAKTVAIVHDEAEFQALAAAALRAARCQVVAYPNPRAMLDEFGDARIIDILVTRVSFAPGMPNGISLALTLRRKCPLLKVVFAARAEWERQTAGIGKLIPHPVSMARLVEAVTGSA